MGVLKEARAALQQHEKEIINKVESSYINPTQEEGKLAREILQQVSDEFSAEISKYGFTEGVRDKIDNRVTEILGTKKSLDLETSHRVGMIIMMNITGLGPIQPFMDDPDVTEIIIQRYNNICIERKGIVERVETSFIDEQHLRTIINRIVQMVSRQLNMNTPMVDARLEDGSRVNATIPPATPDGATMTIRKFSKVALTGEDYLKLGSISRPMLDFLAKCVEGRISMIVSGGTNTGKTTLLNMLSSYIPRNELIITIEDNCELKLNQPNVRRMEARSGQQEGQMPVTIQTLVKNCLRMRPDRIIVGEIRDGTIVDMMSAMSTGHEGSMSTVHANDPENLVNTRLPIMYGQNTEMQFSEEAEAMQIAEALSLIVQISHFADGSRRITHITHIKGVADGRLVLKDIFRYDPIKKVFYATGYVPESIITTCLTRGITFPDALFERIPETPQAAETKKGGNE